MLAESFIAPLPPWSIIGGTAKLTNNPGGGAHVPELAVLTDKGQQQQRDTHNDY